MEQIIIKNIEILDFFKDNKDTSPEKIILDIIRVYSYIKNNSIEKKIDNLIPSINNFDISEKINFFIEKRINENSSQDYNDNYLSILIKKFPSYDIKYTGDQPEYGDYIVKRKDKINILINSIESINNLDNFHIDKFLKNIQVRKTNGIFISQKSGICNKKDMEIEIFGKLVMVYIHNCNYNPSKIEIAINLIDYINTIVEKTEDTGVNISYKTTQLLVNEYTKFFKDKEEIIITMRDNHKKMVEDIQNLKFSKLEEVLSAIYPSFSLENRFSCTFCKNVSFDSQNGLNSHMKKHKKN